MPCSTPGEHPQLDPTWTAGRAAFVWIYRCSKEVEHLTAVHPYVVEFLLFLRQHGKAAWLVTDAHSKTLDLK